MSENEAAQSPVRAQFDQGAPPTIAVFNKATVPLGVDFDSLVAALQAYIDNHIAPVWATPARLVKTIDFQPGAWAMIFIDDADVAGALAYHDLTPDGFPISKVFVKTTLANHDLVSVSASHELVEMLVDPAINLMTTGPNQRLVYAYEAADPVEDLSFLVSSIQMSDFIYPSYFEVFRKPGTDKFDHMNKVVRPFEILSGGYQIVFNGRRWSYVFGSKEKEARFKREDRRGHRSEIRRLRKTFS